jgi:hypothetical protein
MEQITEIEWIQESEWRRKNRCFSDREPREKRRTPLRWRSVAVVADDRVLRLDMPPAGER